MDLRRVARSRVVRFLIVGAFSAGLEMMILISFVEFLEVSYLYANIIAFSITNIVNYTLSRYWVFENRSAKKRIEFPIFMFFVTFGLLINQAVLWYLVDNVEMDYRISKIAAIAAVVVWNYFTRNNIIFKAKETRLENQ